MWAFWIIATEQLLTRHKFRRAFLIHINLQQNIFCLCLFFVYVKLGGSLWPCTRKRTLHTWRSAFQFRTYINTFHIFILSIYVWSKLGTPKTTKSDDLSSPSNVQMRNKIYNPCMLYVMYVARQIFDFLNWKPLAGTHIYTLVGKHLQLYTTPPRLEIGVNICPNVFCTLPTYIYTYFKCLIDFPFKYILLMKT
jgi:hypothetical protein